MNSIINHLGGAVSTVNDMVDAFDSFATNGGWFHAPQSIDAGSNYQQFVLPGTGEYIGYWYCQSYRGSSCKVKVRLINKNSSPTCTILEKYEIKLASNVTKYQLIPYAYANPAVVGMNWSENGKSYNTIQITGIFYKISD